MNLQSRLNSAQFVHTKDYDEVANLQQQRQNHSIFIGILLFVCCVHLFSMYMNNLSSCIQIYKPEYYAFLYCNNLVSM